MCSSGRVTAMDRERPPPCCGHRRPSQGSPLPHPAALRRQYSFAVGGRSGRVRSSGIRAKERLWLMAYTWLLRLPSEALPVCVCDAMPQRGEHKAAVWREGDEICIMLSSRKNLQGGSGVLRRACCCSGNQDMCPAHVLWEQFLVKVPVGTSPWQHISPALVLKWIRAALVALAVGICLNLQCAIVPLLHAGTNRTCIWNAFAA